MIPDQHTVSLINSPACGRAPALASGLIATRWPAEPPSQVSWILVIPPGRGRGEKFERKPRPGMWPSQNKNRAKEQMRDSSDPRTYLAFSFLGFENFYFFHGNSSLAGECHFINHEQRQILCIHLQQRKMVISYSQYRKDDVNTPVGVGVIYRKIQ